MDAHWETARTDPGKAALLARELGVSPLLARLLIQRGVEDPQAGHSFLNPSLQDLHPPRLMKGMDRTVRRILLARQRAEKILIYGDYDVDGITSTVILKRALEMLGAEVDYYLPRRLEEGYGLKTEVIRRAARQGFGVVITADSGIRAFEVCQAARELGIDLIVTDHHLPDRSLPEAYSILNPRQPGCDYPEKNLAAVGVVFKLIHALFLEAGRERTVHHFLKMVAIGTIADLVPLRGENRIIASFGLKGLAQPHNVGLRALLEGSGVGERVDNFDVGFKVAPRINAVTRMGGGREVVDLFSLHDNSRAERIVRQMNDQNQLRRDTESAILAEIEERIVQDPRAFRKKFVVVAGEGWHRGVIGIVASRLVERLHRPVLVVSLGKDICQGSGRSIPGFHLLEALDSCRDLFASYGGHTQAVGCTFQPSRCSPRLLSELAGRLETHADSELSDRDLVPTVRIDAFLDAEDLSLGLCREVERLAPFGMGNPVPRFASRRVEVVGGPWRLKEHHLKLQLRANGSRLDAIWWRQGERVEDWSAGDDLDVAYTLSRDSYQGLEKLLLTIRDLRSASNREDSTRAPREQASETAKTTQSEERPSGKMNAE